MIAAWGTMLRPENPLSLSAGNVSEAPSLPENDVLFFPHRNPSCVTGRDRMVKTNQESAQVLPKWRFYSINDGSAEPAARPMTTLCLKEWNNLPAMYDLAQACLEDVLGDGRHTSRPLLVSLERPRQQRAATGAVGLSTSPLSKAAFQEAVENHIRQVLPSFSLPYFGGLYASHRGATQ